MRRKQLARDLHDLWERAQTIHFQARELLDRIPPHDAHRRLALELALHDLLSFASRAAALASLAEADRPARKKS
jgi:hypothetical protein